MQEIVAGVSTPHQAWTHRSRGFVVAVPPIVTQVEFRSPMGVEIVGHGGAKTFPHVRYLVRSWVIGITERCGHRAAWMQPLIAYEQVPFGIRIALRERGTRDQRYGEE